MTNQLKVAVVDSIYTLQAQGLSQRQIARLLGIDRETVRRHLRLAESNPAEAPLGSEGSEPRPSGPDTDPNPARAPIGSGGMAPVSARVAPLKESEGV